MGINWPALVKRAQMATRDGQPSTTYMLPAPTWVAREFPTCGKAIVKARCFALYVLDGRKYHARKWFWKAPLPP
jgi:hypothetical protein